MRGFGHAKAFGSRARWRLLGELRSRGIAIERVRTQASVDFSTLIRLRELEANGFPGGPEDDFLSFVLANRRQSHAQLFQDLFVLYALGDDPGYFVEFGAADGVTLSNTWLLESEYRWAGILAEPARVWFEELRANRSTIVDKRCVSARSGEVMTFQEDAEDFLFSGLPNSRAAGRIAGSTYAVPTVSLVGLLEEHGAPRTVDYLSVDTEGAELDILAAMDFQTWTFRVMTVEANGKGGELDTLLGYHGYRRVFSSLSNWDNWYLHKSVDLECPA